MNKKMGLSMGRFCVQRTQHCETLPKALFPSVRGRKGQQKDTLDSFQMIRTIGTGSYSVVRLAIDTATQSPVVLKIMKKSHIVVKGQIEHVENERNILASVRSPFIVRLKGTFQTPYYLVHILEFIQGGEMFRYLGIRDVLPEAEVRFYIAEIVCAIRHLHNLHCIYRDLKPENILLTSSGHVKLVDLGFAKVLKPGERTKTLCGTPEYIAPEVIERVGHGAETDWWQVGILAYEMLFAQTPFTDPSPYQLYENILSKPLQIPECSASAKSLLEGLLDKTPANRMRGEDILKSPFFASVSWSDTEELKLQPPYVPRVNGVVDTSNFDEYAEDLKPDKAVLIDVFPYF